MSTFPSPRCSVVGRGLEGVLGLNLGVVSKPLLERLARPCGQGFADRARFRRGLIASSGFGQIVVKRRGDGMCWRNTCGA